MQFFCSDFYANLVDTGVLTLLCVWFILDRFNVYFREDK